MGRVVGGSVVVLAWLTGCVCAPGQMMCGSVCSDPQTDTFNCGSCGTVCEYRCSGGHCEARPECGTADASRASCDDLDPCNGVETCSASRHQCMAGAPIDCDDRHWCTMDSCSGGVCSHTPIDAACDVGQSCDPDMGCIAHCDSPCEVVAPQCGCATGEGCYSSRTNWLCHAAGARLPGDGCTGIYDCAAGAGCFTLSATTTAGICLLYCDDDSDCSQPLACLGRGALNPALPEVGVCATECNLVTSAGCPAGAKCNRATGSDGTSRVTECLVDGAGAEGEACTREDECGRGMLCVRRTSTSECRHWCRLGHSSDCPAGQSCGDFAVPVVIDGVTYGWCG